MFDVKSQLAVQSYCYRHFKTLDGLVGQIKALGLAHVEVSGVHANFADESGFEAILAPFKKAGITIVAIGVLTFKNDPAEESWFRFCKAAGVKLIAAAFDVSRVPAAYRAAEKLADKYDVRLGIHNHGGHDWLGNSTMLQHVFANTSERIGLCIDTAWCLQAAENPVQWAERFNARLYGAHIKDFVFDRAGKPEDVIVGTGNLKLKEFVALLRKAPKLAAVTLEYEGDVENPNPKLKECVEQVAAAV